MKTSLIYDVLIDIVFTDEEFQLLDSAIRNDSQLSGWAQLGQFWYGVATGRPYYVNEDQICTFTTRQVDTVLIKSIEMLAKYPNDDIVKYAKLYRKLMGVLKSAIDRRTKLNKVV